MYITNSQPIRFDFLVKHRLFSIYSQILLFIDRFQVDSSHFSKDFFLDAVRFLQHVQNICGALEHYQCLFSARQAYLAAFSCYHKEIFLLIKEIFLLMQLKQLSYDFHQLMVFSEFHLSLWSKAGHFNKAFALVHVYFLIRLYNSAVIYSIWLSIGPLLP